MSRSSRNFTIFFHAVWKLTSSSKSTNNKPARPVYWTYDAVCPMVEQQKAFISSLLAEHQQSFRVDSRDRTYFEYFFLVVIIVSLNSFRSVVKSWEFINLLYLCIIVVCVHLIYRDLEMFMCLYAHRTQVSDGVQLYFYLNTYCATRSLNTIWK